MISDTMEPDPDNAGVGIKRIHPDTDSTVSRLYTDSAYIFMFSTKAVQKQQVPSFEGTCFFVKSIRIRGFFTELNGIKEISKIKEIHEINEINENK